MGTYEPCVLGSDGNCTRWSHDHAADRETTIGWGGPRPKGILDDPAETTTATTEDAEEVLHGAGWFARADLDPRDLRGILHDLADAGLLRGGDE